MSKRQESLNPAEKNSLRGSEGGIQKGEPRVLSFLVGKVLVWYGIRENLLWLCGYIRKGGWGFRRLFL